MRPGSYLGSTSKKSPNLDIDARGFCLSLRERTCVMGILNVTPDSFSERGEFFDRKKAIRHALNMATDGADVIDVGGESTRPGAKEVGVDEELDRVMPIIESITKSLDIPVSIDTRRAAVAEEAIKAGAAMVNDVSGLKYDPEMARIVAREDVALIVMHMKGTPQDMQTNPTYRNLIKEILESLRESVEMAKRSGVSEDRIAIDPGIGFGKTAEHNLRILNNLAEFKSLGRPICIGTSRKSFIGKVLSLDDPKERLSATLATCVAAIMNGAKIIRVHDVREAVQAARMTDSILREGLT